ncbi:MAG: glycosyltransferase family 4 protein [Lachnospiraceae bacterium]|nr:glycosyltransferase family 4 protein [Lachnospiraceae bacterium]
MTILFATTDYVGSGKPMTGLPAYLYRVSRALSDMGHTPIIMTLGHHDFYRNDDGIEVYTIYVPSSYYKNKCVGYICDAVSKSRIMNRRIKELSYRRHIDVIQFTSLMGLPLCYTGDIPAVLRLSSYARIAFSTHISVEKTLVETMAFFERHSAKRCVAVYAPCQATADQFGRDVGRKVYVLETPFQNEVECYDYSLADGLKGKKYIFFFGILSPEKGIGVIAEIIYRFLDAYRDYTFVFAGQPYEVNGIHAHTLLKQRAKEYADRVILFKPLPHEQLYPIIMGAEFIVLPYFNDNLANACLEAMSFAKVVIGTDGGSFEQVIEHGYNGVLCQRNDPEDLLVQLQYVMNLSSEEKCEMEKNAKRRIDLLKPEIAVKKLVRFYGRVLRYRGRNKE